MVRRPGASSPTWRTFLLNQAEGIEFLVIDEGAAWPTVCARRRLGNRRRLANRSRQKD